MTIPGSVGGAVWRKATPLGKKALDAGAPVVASLARSDRARMGERVDFKFNPQKIAISHAAKLQEIAPPKKITTETEESDDQAETPATTNSDTGGGFGYEDTIKAAGATTISLSDLTFAGDGVVKDCKQLLAWSNAQFQGVKIAPALPKLTFSWGPLRFSVNLIQVDVSYERFTPGGQPVQAKVNLRLQEIFDTLPATNPTSGGIAGRRSHTMVAGENLQHIATANYGRPGAWRALAAANGIEDPLAVRPGAVVYLPAPAELADGGSR
jgi:nucleoid-associated protein YgaU